ncbi:DUF7768 domain-containing protein [Pseudoflavonifractor phocaeensis]|uniref:DUF7768 domain-containing protein n=1 Tax=Pseudoflavonifractor phocaeensis TaxID=1870988 RepID=UPI002108C687|nr:DUF4406 domain-containing protein [Pseudoflavonifractor phocaeensis]MCQ4862685.1 hypothetical protein [Pseudoflavonifractor phocaeensis]
MKVIYIASPCFDDKNKNLGYTKQACRQAVMEGHAFFAPLLLDALMDEGAPGEQFTVNSKYAMIEKCDELWVCGGWITPSILEEMQYAQRFGKPIRCLPAAPTSRTSTTYGIWADARPDGPLAGQSGFLYVGGRKLTFASPLEAWFRIEDIRSLCVNSAPAAEYMFLELECMDSSKRIDFEMLRELDLVPAFTPNNYVERSRSYYDTGGNSMVGTVKFYLSELDKNVWVSCNTEYVIITSTDYMQYQCDDGNDEAERWPYITLYEAFLNDVQPEDAGAWLPMIKEALAFTIEEECGYFGACAVPPAWLPDPIRDTAAPDHLAWLQANKKLVSLNKTCRVEIEPDYEASIQRDPSAMHTQKL